MSQPTAPSPNIVLGSQIKAGRAALGLTQAALAAQVGCSAEMLRKFEAGAKRPSLAVAARLADAFGLAGAARADFLAARQGLRPGFWFPRTKLQPPRPPAGLLARPRLLDPLLRALPHARLILVAAPAGAGKTCLLAAAAAAAPRATAWATLDADDNDPARFLALLIAALGQLAPALSQADLAIDLAGPDRTAQVRRAVAAMINAALALPAAPGLLVLDDLHLIVEPAIYAALAYLIEHLPAHLCLAIASRHEPPLPLARLRARRELLELGQPELGFSASEAAELLAGYAGQAPTAAEVAELHRISAGWAVGLSLLAAALARRESPAERARFLASQAEADPHLCAYLAEELLAPHDADTRRFLRETAVLTELSPQRCQRLTGRADAPAMLDALCRQNLLHSLAPAQAAGAEPAYGYHRLLRAFLLGQLRRESPARLRELHRLAAAVEPHRASEHLLAAEEWAAAAAAIGGAGQELLARGEHQRLQELLAALPQGELEPRPQLRYLLAICAWRSWDLAGAAALLGAAAADFARAGDAVGQGQALVALASVQGQAGGLARAADTAAQALLLPLRPAQRVRLLSGRAWYGLVGGELRQAASDLDEALAIAEAHSDADTYTALSEAIRGSLIGLPGGNSRVERLSRLAAKTAAPEAAPIHAAVAAMQGWLAIWCDRWDAAQAASWRALELCGPDQAFSTIYGEAYLQLSVCAALGRDPQRADERFAHMLADLEPGGALSRSGRAGAVLHALARVRWLQGRHDDLEAVFQRMAAEQPASIWPADAVLVREVGALLRLAEGQAEGAIVELRQVAASPPRMAIAPVLGDPRLHLAQAYLQAGRPDQAAAAAGPALAAIQREGMPGRLRWHGPGLVGPILRLFPSGPLADFAAAALARL